MAWTTHYWGSHLKIGEFSIRRLWVLHFRRFSGGPTSQLETIELRGFDEPVKKTNGKEKDNEVRFY